MSYTACCLSNVFGDDSRCAASRPLHWAVQNKHVDCVKALLELYPGSDKMNVLEKNSFGKSALSDVSDCPSAARGG